MGGGLSFFEEELQYPTAELPIINFQVLKLKILCRRRKYLEIGNSLLEIGNSMA